jgi:hypothetical protein
MLPEMRAELGFRLRNPPTEGGVSEKTRCTADSQVLSAMLSYTQMRGIPKPFAPAHSESISHCKVPVWVNAVLGETQLGH